MDLDGHLYKSFDSKEKMREILARPMPLSVPALEATWNSVLSDYQALAKLKIVILSQDEEVTLFLKMNYARMRLKHLLRTLLSNGALTAPQNRSVLRWGALLVETRDALTVCNLGLSFAMGKNYHMFIPNAAEANRDLLVEGFIAVINSADRFDAERNIKFSTYACRSVVQAMRRHRGKVAKEKTLPAADRIDPHSMAGLDQVTKRMLIEDALRNAELDDQEREVLDMRFWRGMPLDVIGEKMQIDGTTVMRIQKRAVSKLGQYIKGKAA